MMTSLLIKFLRFKVLFNLPLALQPYLKIGFGGQPGSYPIRT